MEQGEGNREFSAVSAKPKPEFSFTKAIHARLQTSMGEWERRDNKEEQNYEANKCD
jgi:hypothetical protein